MSAIYYTALRSLMVGHIAQDDYSFDIPMQVIDRSVQATRTSNKALSGKTAHYLHRVETTWSFQTYQVDITSTECAQMREFLDSCIGGQQFTIDPYGTVASPLNNLVVQMESTTYNENRVGTSNFVTFSFNVRVIQ